MPGKLRSSFLLFTIWIPGVIFAQQPGIQGQLVEDLLYNNEETQVPVEIYEAYSDLESNPINLNTASGDQMGESGLFTPYQIHVLIKYRESYGELFSIYELTGLTGFRKSRLQGIAPYLTVEKGALETPKKQNPNLVMINIGKILPKARGYVEKETAGTEPAYAGTPMKTNVRIKSHAGRNLTFGLTYEKDAGEKFLYGKKPEFLSGYVCYRGSRLIKQWTVGTFQLNHGLGLVNGAGFIHSPESFQVRRQSLSLLRNYASKSENRFERGLGCRLDLKPFELMLWSSYTRQDLSLGKLPENRNRSGLWTMTRSTGLHRTNEELDGRGLAYRFHSGVQVLYSLKNLDMGAMIGFEIFDLTRNGLDSLKMNAAPVMYQTISLHGNWQSNRLQLFGELATGKWESTALLVGAACHFNDFLQVLMLLHHYGNEYRGSQPSSYASGSRIGNEQGVALQFHAEPGKHFTADFTGELFIYPSPRYQSIVPSTGYRYSFTFMNTRKARIRWKIRMVKKGLQTTPANDAVGLRGILNTKVTRFDFRMDYDYNGILVWQSRLLISLLSKNSKPIPGYVAAQQVNFNPTRYFKITVQFVVFNVTEWANRIYLYEPGLYYSFNFPAYYGTGQKTTAVFTLKPIKRVTLAGKVGIINYDDRETIGSGNDLIPGNTKWELGLQIRLNL